MRLKMRSLKFSGILLALVFMLMTACSYVGIGDDDSGDNWWDGLSTQQMVDGMMIEASESQQPASRASEEGKNIQVTWSLPVKFTNWRISVKYGNDEKVIYDYEDLANREVDIEIKTGQTEWDATEVWIFKFFHKVIVIPTQFIVTYKIEMIDHNGDKYENVVSFMVFPENRKLNVSLNANEIESGALSSLYYIQPYQVLPICHIPEGSTKVFDDIHADNGTFSINLNSFHDVQFAILTDFTYQNWDGITKIAHYSNTSYCKVTKEENPNDGAEATFKYAFEDLPITRLSAERDGKFDYNDVVFYVDVVNPN